MKLLVLNADSKKKVNTIRKRLMKSITNRIGSSNEGTVKPEAIHVEEIKKILVCRPNSRLGNQLLITPLLQELLDTFPNAHIDLFVRGGVAPVVLKNYDRIDKYIMLPPKPFKSLFSYLKVWFKIRSANYDLVINAVNDSSSGKIATKIAKAPVKFYSDTDEHLKAIHDDYSHIAKTTIYNFREFLAHSLFQEDKTIPPLNIKLKESDLKIGREIARKITDNSQKDIITLYTFATGDKCYSKEWWREFYTEIKNKYSDQYTIVEVLPKENVSQIDFAATSYYSTNLFELASFIANTKLFITGDCGVMHLASAVNVPVVGLFSVTSPINYGVYNQGSISLITSQESVSTIMSVIDTSLTKREVS